jgi:hypothetical protein
VILRIVKLCIVILRIVKLRIVNTLRCAQHTCFTGVFAPFNSSFS